MIKQLITTVNKTVMTNKNNQYIVVHYTANNGDTAYNNAKYFYDTNRSASAHYFVDENEIYQVVLDKDSAWHVGASTYVHNYCRNSNSIGIEMCSRIDSAGNYYIKDEIVDSTVNLVQDLMNTYDIPIENVLRHYDVTGKTCPAPFVNNEIIWSNFKNKLEEKSMTVYEAKNIIKAKVGLSDSTIEFLYNYRYGDDLLIKIANAL